MYIRKKGEIGYEYLANDNTTNGKGLHWIVSPAGAIFADKDRCWQIISDFGIDEPELDVVAS